MSTFKEISPFEIAQNPFSLIGKDWALVTAKNGDGCNTMTASWGGVGIMWNKPVTFAFIRPQRFTFGLLENEEYFSMSFYPEEYRKALTFCGTKSGRDVDKVKECGFTPNYSEKIIDESVVLPQYNGDDYHKMYISEIVKVLSK